MENKMIDGVYLMQQEGTSCFTRSCSSARLASLKRSSVPTRYNRCISQILW